jgi:hypothetical protein
MPVVALATLEYLQRMGDKSPKSKQRDKKQKDAVKVQSKNDSAKRQASFSAQTGKEKK